MPKKISLTLLFMVLLAIFALYPPIQAWARGLCPGSEGCQPCSAEELIKGECAELKYSKRVHGKVKLISTGWVMRVAPGYPKYDGETRATEFKFDICCMDIYPKSGKDCKGLKYLEAQLPICNEEHFDIVSSLFPGYRRTVRQYCLPDHPANFLFGNIDSDAVKFTRKGRGNECPQTFSFKVKGELDDPLKPEEVRADQGWIFFNLGGNSIASGWGSGKIDLPACEREPCEPAAVFGKTDFRETTFGNQPVCIEIIDLANCKVRVWESSCANLQNEVPPSEPTEVLNLPEPHIVKGFGLLDILQECGFHVLTLNPPCTWVIDIGGVPYTIGPITGYPPQCP
jgi:hypothetical protein